MKTLAVMTLMFAACAGQKTAQMPPGVRISAEFKETPTRIFVTHAIARACSVSEAREADLDRVANCLSNGALKGRPVEVTGQLGISRADSVATYLERKGVPVRVSSRTKGAPNAVSISVD